MVHIRNGTKRSAKVPLLFAAALALALRVPADALAGRLRRAAVPRTVLAPSSCPAAAALALALDLPSSPLSLLPLLATSWQSSSSSESESSRHTGSAAVPATTVTAVDADEEQLFLADDMEEEEAAAGGIILSWHHGSQSRSDFGRCAWESQNPESPSGQSVQNKFPQSHLDWGRTAVARTCAK